MIEINGQTYYGIIYKIENTITHSIYIGQTANPRGFDGRYSHNGKGVEKVYGYLSSAKRRNQGYNKHLFRAIEKYGFDAFEVDKVFDVASSAEELNEKEMYYIKKFDSYKNGYNQVIDGDVAKGADCHNSKRVCQIGLDGKLIKIWGSQTEAAEVTGTQISRISCVCSGKNKTAGGYVWVQEKDYDKNKDYSRKPRTKDMGKGTKPVVLLSDTGEVIERFYSVNDTGKRLGIKPQRVSVICTKHPANAEFNLKYEEEYLEEQRLSEKTHENVMQQSELTQ